MFKIYTKENCSYCDKAKMLLQIKGLEYQELNAMENLHIFKTNGWATVPQIFHYETHVGGYDDLVEYLKEDKED